MKPKPKQATTKRVEAEHPKPKQVFPFTPRMVGEDVRGLVIAVRIDQRGRADIPLHVGAPVVAQSQGGVQGGVADWLPDVDDLETLLQQLRRLGLAHGEVNAVNNASGRLVSVCAGGGLSDLSSVCLVGSAAAKGYVEWYEGRKYKVAVGGSLR